MAERRVNICGHPERKHKAFGMCIQCWKKARYAVGKDAESTRLWRINNADKVRESNRRAIKTRDRQKQFVRQKQWTQQNAARVKDGILRRIYGITLAHFNEMLEAQQGLCAICKEVPATEVDHNHATNEVRGLLCEDCNRGIGIFREQECVLQNAITYLQERGADPKAIELRQMDWSDQSDESVIQLSLLESLG